VEPKLAVLKPLSAAISIGSGGPFGAEGPIIMTGGAFGSIIAQMFHLTSAERKTLLVAGSAAGMSAVFGSPIAAVLLAVELLLFEWKPRSFVPVALASATAAAVRPSLMGDGAIFRTPEHHPTLNPETFLATVACGITAAFLAMLLTGAVYAAEDAFKKLPIHWMWWPALGSVVIGLGGLIEPRVLGVGYETIEAILRGQLLGAALIAVITVKAIIWSVSLGSGTSGGVLAPLLMMGAAMGAMLARILPDEGTGFWALIGMAAVLGGTMRSPLTATIFAVEITHDWGALLPLLIACSAAHGFSVLVLKRSILTEKVARRGFHVSREYAVDPLELIFVREVMSPVSLRESSPPLDEVVVARSDETLVRVAQRMARHNCTELLVTHETDGMQVVGRVTLADLLKARARHAEQEERRERVIPATAFIPKWLRPALSKK
jgi:H+/Cl- antiporter ClcA